MQGWFNTYKTINIMVHIIKDKNNMIVSKDTEKNIFHKIQHHFHDKSAEETRNRSIHLHNAGYL
jgi:hypothetical protein